MPTQKNALSMDLGMTERLQPIHEKVADMIENEILPLDEEFLAEVSKGDRWSYTPRQTEILEGLKSKAKERGLWNFWLTDSDKGYGLTTVEYAYLAEEMGKAHLGAEVFNCSAPDTGNMEVFERYGTEKHKKEWLSRLLEGEIRSAYLMTEPDVASSDATNIAISCVRDGDDYVLNGEKWWSSGAGDPRCAVYIVMVHTPDESRSKHQQHSQIIVDAKTPGIEILRSMQVYGEDDAPHGHMHIRFKDVRVPAENLLLGEGRGFEISQGRLGPGRIHHCMRAIGQAERALELMCKRSLRREAFGKQLAQLGANYDIIANCRMEIEQARLLCLKAATNSKGADVIFEVVGGDVFHACSRAINWNGRILVVGFANGDIPQFPVNIALVKGASVVGVFWGTFTQKEPGVFAGNMKELFGWYQSGTIKPLVEQRFPLEHAVDALQHIHDRKASGKVVLIP